MEGNANQWIPVAVLGIVGGAVLYFVQRDQRAMERYHIGEMWDRLGVGFTDATDAQRQAVQDRMDVLRRSADAIAEAPGLLSDNEGAALAALFAMRSRFELLWLNRRFVGTDWRSLGVFDDPTQTPQLGAYLDRFLSTGDWIDVLNWYERLPKY